MTIRVELVGTEAVRAAFASLVPKLQQQATAQLAQKVFEDVRAGAARHTRYSRTGRLVNSIRLHKVPGGFRVFHDQVYAPHAPFVLHGTHPHLIKPKDPNGVLRFFTRSGSVVFAKFARHPGTKPDDYIRRAYEGAGRHFTAILHKLQQARFK